MHIASPLINNHRHMQIMVETLADELLRAKVYDRGGVHAQKTESDEHKTKEVGPVVIRFNVPEDADSLQRIVEPNLPWAEEHFQERIDRTPVNPPPSHESWPFAQKDNDQHMKAGVFSHTYPERFWPKRAGQEPHLYQPLQGIRFAYGDLQDMVALLRRNPRTRQAYLPVWFPEDLSAAKLNERVPCTLGYHFLQSQREELDCTYFIRSCDFVRFFFDDLYMAGRLLQWVAKQSVMRPGELTMYIVNLHCFQGDNYWLQQHAVSEDDEDVYLGGITG